MKAKYIPNILSCIRILMTGLFIFLFFHDYPDNVAMSGIVFLLAGITDVVDGQIARRFNYVTSIGKLLDPLADKLMQCSVLFCLAYKQVVPFWILMIYIIKELTMAVGSLVLFRRRHVISVSHNFGRAMVVLFYAILLTILFFGGEGGFLSQSVVDVLCVIAAAGSVAALVFYFVSYISRFKSKDTTLPAKSAKDISTKGK